MLKVKEFLNFQDATEEAVNDWFSENEGKVDIVDVKYSVGCLQADQQGDAQEFSGVLVLYR